MEKHDSGSKRSGGWITVVGAREHNLKNITTKIPKDTLTVITGPSGSGKSSLALDILYTEGKRRYMESLSSYARQFLGIAKKPAVDRIDGLCPAIAIEQKTVGSNPRSTVGTITEIYDYLRVLFARIGQPHCPECGTAISPASPEHITDAVLHKYAGQFITIAAPVAHQKKGEFTDVLYDLYDKGYYRYTIDGQKYKFKNRDEISLLKLGKTYKHTIDVLIDALTVGDTTASRIAEAVEAAFAIANGQCKIIATESSVVYSSARMCVDCGVSCPELEPRLFSFNSPIGACKTCSGLGTVNEWPWDDDHPDAWKAKYPDFFGKYATSHVCRECGGKRLNEFACAVTVGGKNIYELSVMAVKDLVEFFGQLTLSSVHQEIAGALIIEIKNRLQFLYDVGLSYLSLDRKARTLSGGEGQRIRLATQIGSALSGVVYVLDEPSIGLHQRDNDRLIATLKSLRDQGNTVVVVEHDLDTMRHADYLIDMGPAAGVHGGQVTAAGLPQDVAKNRKSLSGAYLSGKKNINVPEHVREPREWLTLKNAKKHNLKNVELKLPLGVLCGVSGVSGSGKSSLIMHELVPTLTAAFKRGLSGMSARRRLDGSSHLDALVVIDQSPIGRTPRSNPATYLGIFDDIRKLFSQLPESQARGYKVGRFSFNVPHGRCYECNGDGTITVSMHFLPDVTMQCKSCKGLRYNKETLQIRYKSKNIADVLDMTAWEAYEFFKNHRGLAKRLQLMCDVGLDYIKLGQPSTTLSGGEAQRIKLVNELAKRGSNTLYVLDEPTTGLHNSDIEKLLLVLNRLVAKGNSMVVIEHNLDVLKTVDYLIDLGPEGGDGGGTIVAHGTPQEVAACNASHTGRYLRLLL